MSTSLFPLNFASLNITIPHTPLIEASYNYAKQHILPTTLAHCMRNLVFAFLLINRLPGIVPDAIDTEVLAVSILLHDMGLANTTIVSNNTRFEVDGANIARAFVRDHNTSSSSSSPSSSSHWDRHRVQLMWDTIALHTTLSIAAHGQPEVALAAAAIVADFFGPYMPPGATEPGQLMSVGEYLEVVRAFPRPGFREGFVERGCSLCRRKKETTWDNIMGEFGATFGLDGNGTGREEFAAEFGVQRNGLPPLLVGLDRLKPLDDMAGGDAGENRKP
ncbi:hypothetical protein RB595_003901 [Gaeumannomyces hyphopodioides]